MAKPRDLGDNRSNVRPVVEFVERWLPVINPLGKHGIILFQFAVNLPGTLDADANILTSCKVCNYPRSIRPSNRIILRLIYV